MSLTSPDDFSMPPLNTDDTMEGYSKKKNMSFEADDDYVTMRHNRHSVSWVWAILVLAAGCLIFYLVHLNDHVLPEGITAYEAEQNPRLFSGERSRTTLRKLAALGPRVVGDRVNEVDAPNIIIDEVREAIATAHASQHINYTKQMGSGAYTLGFKPPFTNIYDDIQNVIVKLDGSEGQHSIMVNCHYDSVYEADGASDDIVNCAVMIEILRVLSKSPTRLKHNIVLLFNGAEEVPLQGAHLFLQHEWANKTRMFLNLEAAGTGGRSILFQTGPRNSWILKYYSKHAPHPHGQIMGEDMFQSGMIPSDSDFRIFRDYGNMPGLDFAFCRNGHIYHTLYDTEEYIPVGSHQHMGDNILAMLRVLGNAEEINDITRHSEGQMVYYDYLGWFMVSYSAEGAIAINIIMVLISICSIAVFIGRLLHWSWLPFSTYSAKANDYSVFHRKLNVEPETVGNLEPVHNMTTKMEVLKEFSIVVGTRIVSLGAAIGVTAIVGLIVNAAASLVMPWYSNVWLIFPLYWCPFLIVFSGIPYAVDKWRMKKHGLSLSLTTQMNIIGSEILWIFALFLMTCMGIRSASMFLVPVIFFTISNLIMFLTPLYLTTHEWIWAYLVLHLPALLMNTYLGLIIYIIFVPVLGRSGKINSDLSMALVTSVVCLLVASLAVPLTTLVRKPFIIFGILTAFSILMIILSLATNIGHPYQVGPNDPKVQRYWIMHTFREYRDENQDVRKSESGYFVLNLDPNSPKTIPLRSRTNVRYLEEDCDEEPYCGLPLYMTRMVPLSPKSSWIPAGKPVQVYETEIVLDGGKRCDAATRLCELKLILKGPDRLTVTFTPREGASLVDWSIPTAIEVSGEWKGRPTYYLHIVRGQHLTPNYEISLTFEVTPEVINAPILDIGLGGNHVYHIKERTSEFQSFLNTLPEWTHKTGWISAYKSYVY